MEVSHEKRNVFTMYERFVYVCMYVYECLCMLIISVNFVCVFYMHL